MLGEHLISEENESQATGAREMALSVKCLPWKPKDLDLVPRIHVRCLL